MVLDINLFRKEKGGNPDKIKESERKRYHDESNVDKVIECDDKWRKCIFELEELKKNMNMINKEIGNKKKADKNADVEDLKKKSLNIKEEIPKYQLKEKELLKERNKYISKIGNLLNIKVVCSDNEDNNKIVKTWGECKILAPCEETDSSIHDNVINNNNIKRETLNNEIENKKKIKYYYHYDLLRKIGGANFKKGIQVAGHRGYYLTGAGFLLHNAILQYALNFLVNKKYVPVYPPFFMKKNIMEECAELDDFEETLYKISSTSNSALSSQQLSSSPTNVKNDTACSPQKKTNIPSNEDLTRDDLFLIATSEQPLCALHKDETIESKRLPLKYAGLSSCFRKEAGAHGKDIRGILRVHQFDKVEQFCISLPQNSNKVHEEMIKTCEEFYQSLNIPYRIVSIVSGALNNAASIKYDLEGFFPTSNQYRELVSCSNCTDYQSINLNIRYSDSSIKINDLNKNTNLNDEMDTEYEQFLKNFHTENKYHVHLLNGTMVAAQRFLCCLLENYQNGEGIVVPEKLRPYMNNMDFIPFTE
ncbi:putative serine--tRNA ligase [Plasmodium gaboni]|uniref:serine--tRNA ligase n=1 Tax=Plasmodium gaboni TaxID=647221 RepID=A0A151LQ44_9APIC|nr:putative serine--tRNA ligase [Plasmodium gaboni]KYO01315.1 putative serine--tRNA ligase [Plasmodium gaboni]